MRIHAGREPNARGSRREAVRWRAADLKLASGNCVEELCEEGAKLGAVGAQ